MLSPAASAACYRFDRMGARGSASTAVTLRQGFAETWGGVDGVVAGLDRDAWATPTGCPGWTVRDCVAHIAALERVLLGEPVPVHTVPDGLAHVTDDVHRYMEVGVDLRRSWPVERVLADFREATGARLADLEELTDADLDGERQFIFGTGPARRGLGIRLFDCWSHEQDIRRALGTPGGLAGVAAAHCREQLVRGVGGAVQEALQPSAGTTVLFDVVGESAARRGLAFDGDAARAADPVVDPTVTLHLDLNTLAVLGCGRHDDPEARERVEVEGDTALGRRMLEHFGFTP